MKAPFRFPRRLSYAADLAVKGKTAPAIDMPPRMAPSQAITLSQQPRAGVALQPVNSRLCAGFRRSLNTDAARYDLKLNELLVRSFDAYRA
jgi:hypothetical protein